MRAVLAVLLLAALTAHADETLWKLVQGGGQVLFLRHAETTPGIGDPPGFKLEDCTTQRNLSDEGRHQSERMGDAFRARKVPVDEVLASPWCRCIDTARLAFGRARNWEPLSNLFGRQEAAADQVRALRARVGAWRGKGNLVLVSHGSTGAALTGQQLAMGEFFVLTPRGRNGFIVAGRLQ